ncbi:hypothetical protein HETIRDRAFT_104255 [Heterobasidion irregulare TC 32-1]|uniref:Fungal-type protein kinase domain-containing protein n=1 Tax=Heterobasidion irregulare (strain TC 32-1) TaxID=747525 RepID=W4K0R5_HETIT|nr:uncharacterized protein HETIRDRAFT_104255 [Heterobasidion irregulare TC 32-1]ETW78925.1 hypothetical protein HETIRDRAFT_104255 [Heterobasidion irregulare TC 32-1]
MSCDCTKSANSNWFPSQKVIDGYFEEPLGFPRVAVAGERDSYLPLNTLLAKALEVDGKGKLKPDLTGCLRKLKPMEKVPWREIEVGIEVKDDWLELLKQANTYGRSMLEEGSRWYALVIAVNHRTSEARFCWYTRLGLFLTPALDLTKKEGLTTFVGGIFGLAACDRERAGNDPCQVMLERTLHFLIPPPAPTFWRWSKTFCRRICVRGRATHVYRIGPAANLPEQIQERPEDGSGKEGQKEPWKRKGHNTKGIVQSWSWITYLVLFQRKRGMRYVQSPLGDVTGTQQPPSNTPEPSSHLTQVQKKTSDTAWCRLLGITPPTWTNVDVHWKESIDWSKMTSLVMKDSWPIESTAKVETEMFSQHYTAFFPFPSLPALANLIKLQPFLVTLSLPALIFSALTRMLTPLVRRMRLYVAGTDALASGCVCARGVLPDVLVFDSAVPQPDAPPKMYSSNSRPRADAPLPPPQ